MVKILANVVYGWHTRISSKSTIKEKGRNEMKIDKSLLSGSTSLLVLSLLSDRDKYGYEMIQQLTLRSENIFEMKEGTLYPVLHGLEKDGYIQGYEKETESGRKRRYYHITDKGRRQLQEQTDQWRAFSGAVEKILEPRQIG